LPFNKAVKVFRATFPERVFGNRRTATIFLNAATGPISRRTEATIAFSISSGLNRTQISN